MSDTISRESSGVADQSGSDQSSVDRRGVDQDAIDQTDGGGQQHPADPDADEAAARVALACLPSMWPRRLAAILRSHSGLDAWERLRRGAVLDAPLECAAAPRFDDLRTHAADYPTPGTEAWRTKGIEVIVRGEDGYPSPLALHPEPPEVLFFRGDLGALAQRRVAIVGTRNATAAGRATATQLGSELASAGLAVVSGLARGIDAAAHRGVRDATLAATSTSTSTSAGTSADRGAKDHVCSTDPDGVGGTEQALGSAVAVVGSGIDVCYPKSNESVWNWVAHHGLVLSEWPPGAAPEAWHFPLRNRIIAGLSEVVVVVESRRSGGSLITAEAALERGIDVLAVPGSRYCEAAVGTNQLIADGAGMVRHTDDVLAALDLAVAPLPNIEQLLLPGMDASPLADRLLRMCAERPLTLDELVVASGESVFAVARAVTELQHVGAVRAMNGWVESIGSRLA